MTSDLALHAKAVLRAALGPVVSLIDDEAVSEIMINRNDSIWFERAGTLYRFSAVLTGESLRAAVCTIATLAAREARERGPAAIVEARLEGMRIAAAFPPVSVAGLSMCVRKHVHRGARLDDYTGERLPASAQRDGRELPARPAAQVARGDGWRTQESLPDLLRRAVARRCNILVSGATSSGKTTFLNALLAAVPAQQRIVTIEDTAELRVGAPNAVGFETDPSAGIGLRELVRLSLRYRPDRIVVGEVRGAEAFELMQALATGHDGGFATVHATGATAALDRLEQLVMTSAVPWPAAAIRRQIAATFDLVVHLARVGGTRRVVEVSAVTGWTDRGYVTESLYRLQGARTAAAPAATGEPA